MMKLSFIFRVRLSLTSFGIERHASNLGGPDNLLSGWPQATGGSPKRFSKPISATSAGGLLRASRARTTSCPGHPSGKSISQCYLVVLGFFAFLMLSADAQSVLPNGDFEQADPAHPGKPAHWDLPDGLGVQWTDAPAVAGAPPHGKAIRIDTSVSEIDVVASYAKAGLTQWVFPHPQGNAIAETYGLSLYSEAVPIAPGKTYRVTFDYLAEKGTSGKLWFRAYGDVNGEKKRAYEGTIDCSGGPTWKQFTGVFHPTKYRPNVTEFKIMLFAYYPAGVAWFDNIKVETVDDAPAAAPTP